MIAAVVFGLDTKALGSSKSTFRSRPIVTCLGGSVVVVVSEVVLVVDVTVPVVEVLVAGRGACGACMTQKEKDFIAIPKGPRALPEPGLGNVVDCCRPTQLKKQPLAALPSNIHGEVLCERPRPAKAEQAFP